MSTVRREIVLPVERERAWELLTEPAELSEWLADEVELEPEEGAPLRVAWAERRGARGRRRGGRGASAGCASAGTTTRPASPRASSGRSTTRRAARASSSRSARSCRSRCAACRSQWRAARDAGIMALARAAALVATRDVVDVDAVFAALADPTRRAVIGRLAQEPASASRARGRAADQPPGDRQAPRGARPRGPRRGAPRGPRDALRARPGADGRGDGLDGLGRRAVGRAARAAGRRAAAAPRRAGQPRKSGAARSSRQVSGMPIDRCRPLQPTAAGRPDRLVDHHRRRPARCAAVRRRSPMRAAGIPPIMTLRRAHRDRRRAGRRRCRCRRRARRAWPAIRTVGAPGGRIGPPTCGFGPSDSGHVCMSPTRAAGGIRRRLSRGSAARRGQVAPAPAAPPSAPARRPRRR